MSNVTNPGASGAAIQTTTKGREMLGWIGAMTYMFLMMWGYQIFLIGNMGFTNGSPIESLAMLAFAVFIALFGYRCGRDPNRLADIAMYTTPAAIVLTVVCGLLPDPFDSILYILACALASPAIARSVYGVIRTAKQGYQITRYMIGWTVALTVFAFWVIVGLPRATAFIIPALFAVLMWIGTLRKVSTPDEPPAANAFKFSRGSILIFVLMVLVMMWFNLMADQLLNNLFAGGDVTSETVSIISTLMTWIPLGLAMTLFALISDKGRERAGFMISMGLFLVSIMGQILINSTKSPFYTPLAAANTVGGMYVVFFSCAFPLYFLLKGAKRPAFIASGGLIFFAAFQAFCWQKNLYLPDSLLQLGIPLYVTAAISSVAFIVLVYLLFERYREKTLSAALYDLLHHLPKSEVLDSGKPDAQVEPNMATAGLTAGEMNVALLLIEGETRRDISRKLHLSAPEVSQSISAIREKVIHTSDPDPDIAAAIIKFKLTRRETDVLRCLRRSMTNPEIAAELFLSEETVKSHVRSLMKKLPIKNRGEIATWTGTIKE